MADSNGIVTESAIYDSFGNKITSNLTTRYQYTGREADEYTGLMYYRARFYDPQIGRFISEDPIGFRGGINWYSYVNNNPIRHRDPSGLIGLYAYPDGTPSNPHNIIEYYDAYNDLHYRRVWGHQRYPGEENSAMRHCVVSCESGSLWGAGTVRMMGIGNETQGLVLDIRRWWNNTPTGAFQWEDLQNNERGFDCQNRVKNGCCTTCVECCSGGCSGKNSFPSISPRYNPYHRFF